MAMINIDIILCIVIQSHRSRLMARVRQNKWKPFN